MRLAKTKNEKIRPALKGIKTKKGQSAMKQKAL